MIIPHEQYTLTLRHEYVDQDGQCHNLEEPIVVSYLAMKIDQMTGPSSSIVINEMMQRMERYIIERRMQNEGIEHI